MIDIIKQSENSFGKGMLLDAYPLNLYNETLSSCLNGTLITNNGNDRVLLNDMGNARVETAKLPAGYVPVGIKEFGGIIYVASYNPITNKSQIGSFPSPERNLSSEELGKPDLFITKNTFGFDNTSGVSTLYTKLLALDDTTLRPGDKFAIGFNSSDLSGISNVLSDYNNSGNKLLKLSVAIRDVNGNLINITNKLKRFNTDTGEEIDYGGYYMLPIQSNSSEQERLENLRTQLKTFNVYDGKLSGELYLVAELNSIDNYELAVRGIKKDINSDLVFTGSFLSEIGDLFKYVKLDLKSKGSYLKGYLQQLPINLGSNKFKHDFKVLLIENDAIVDYEITPVLSYGDLNNFTKKGSINMKLIGTGAIELPEWRYYNDFDNNQLSISWGLQAYLRLGAILDEFIDYVNFKFYRYKNDKTNTFSPPVTITAKKRKVYNGNFIETINYDLLDKYLLYLVQIEIKTIFDKQPNYTYMYKFLYTSDYFNQFYVENDVLDFSNISINLNLNSKIKLEKLNTAVDNPKILNKSPYVLKDKPDENFKFEYSKYSLTNDVYNIKSEHYLTKEETFPFKANSDALNVTNTLKESSALVQDLNIISSSDIANFLEGFITNGQALPKEETITKDKLCYSENLSGNVLTIKTNTISKYNANSLESEIASQAVDGYRPYLNPDTFSDIFGYPKSNYMTAPKYGLAAKAGVDDRKFRTDVWIVGYNQDPTNEKTAPNELLETVRSGKHTDNGWKDFIQLEVTQALSNNFQKNPNIVFWIGGCPQDVCPVEGDKYGTTHLVTSGGYTTINYNMVLWKSSNNVDYYLLNEFFPKAGKRTGLSVLSELFENLYINQQFYYSGTVYKSKDYSYTNGYNIKYSGTIESAYTQKPDSNLVVSNLNKDCAFNPETINVALKKNELKEKYIETDGSVAEKRKDLSNFILNSKNLQVNVSISKNTISSVSVENKACELDSKTIVNYVEGDYTVNNGVLVSKSGEIYDNVADGSHFDPQTIYYIGNDNLVHPISDASYVTSSALGPVVSSTSLARLSRSLMVDLNENKKMNHIRIKAGSAPSLKTASRQFEGKDKSWPGFGNERRNIDLCKDMQGNLIDLCITGNPNKIKS